MESRLTSLREELDESKSNEMAIHEDIKQTETENSELKKQLSTLTEKIALLQTQFEQQLQSVSFELEKEQARYQKLKKQYDILEERTSRTAEVAASSDSYIIQNLTEENARLKVENQKQQATTRKLESERSDVTQFEMFEIDGREDCRVGAGSPAAGAEYSADDTTWE